MSILVTYAIALVFEGILNYVFSVNEVQLQAWYVNKSFPIFGIYIPYIEVFGFIMVVVLLSALYYMLYRTRFGASVRASLRTRRRRLLSALTCARCPRSASASASP